MSIASRIIYHGQRCAVIERIVPNLLQCSRQCYRLQTAVPIEQAFRNLSDSFRNFCFLKSRAVCKHTSFQRDDIARNRHCFYSCSTECTASNGRCSCSKRHFLQRSDIRKALCSYFSYVRKTHLYQGRPLKRPLGDALDILEYCSFQTTAILERSYTDRFNFYIIAAQRNAIQFCTVGERLLSNADNIGKRHFFQPCTSTEC